MEKTSDEAALLIAQSGPLNGQRWAVRAELLLGRDDICSIVIPDRQVSRQHAVIKVDPDGITIEDLGSKNGTHLNGKKIIEAALLQDGDSIEIALAQKFVFLSSDATVPLVPDFVNFTSGVDGAPIGSAPEAAPKEAIKVFRRLRLDKKSHRVWIRVSAKPHSAKSKTTHHETEVDPPLSASQFRMLEMLYDQPGEVISRQDLIAGVWGLEEAVGVSEQALDALIRRLRDRLASIDHTHTYIITVRGHGLRLDNPVITG